MTLSLGGLADWTEKNKDWPTLKPQLIAEQEQLRADALQEMKAIKDKPSQIRDSRSALLQEVRAADLRVQVLKRLAAIKGDIDFAQLPYRPSSYDILSIPQERQRLQKLLNQLAM